MWTFEFALYILLRLSKCLSRGISSRGSLVGISVPFNLFVHRGLPRHVVLLVSRVSWVTLLT
jgi:hypothetical protein